MFWIWDALVGLVGGAGTEPPDPATAEPVRATLRAAAATATEVIVRRAGRDGPARERTDIGTSEIENGALTLPRRGPDGKHPHRKKFVDSAQGPDECLLQVAHPVV